MLRHGHTWKREGMDRRSSASMLLVDGDIRRPSQFLIFGMEPKEENELGEYLRGNGSLADVMVP